MPSPAPSTVATGRLSPAGTGNRALCSVGLVLALLPRRKPLAR